MSRAIAGTMIGLCYTPLGLCFSGLFPSFNVTSYGQTRSSQLQGLLEQKVTQ